MCGLCAGLPNVMSEIAKHRHMGLDLIFHWQIDLVCCICSSHVTSQKLHPAWRCFALKSIDLSLQRSVNNMHPCNVFFLYVILLVWKLQSILTMKKALVSFSEYLLNLRKVSKVQTGLNVSETSSIQMFFIVWNIFTSLWHLRCWVSKKNIQTQIKWMETWHEEAE